MTPYVKEIWGHSVKYFLGGNFMSEKLKTPDSQRKAIKKYLSKFVDIKIRVTPETRDVIQNHAQKTGESMASFINRAIAETMARDKEKNTDK